MTILRIHKKQNNFVILDKTCLYCDKLSWGAKGLHAFLISMPDDWQVRVSDLQKRAINGSDAVRAFLTELASAGYIKKSMSRNEETGRFNGMEFLVLETPDQDLALNSPQPEKPSVVKIKAKKPKLGNPSPSTGNPTLINNKIAAANKSTMDQDLAEGEIKTAVVNFYHKKVEKNLTQSHPQRAEVYVFPNSKTLIGDTPSRLSKLKQELLEAKITEKYLKRILGFSKESVKLHLAKLVVKQKQKISEIEKLINQVTSANKVQSIIP